jgi:oligo-1,6-glucosidase
VPWFPVQANHVEINAERALADPESVFHHYRRLIELRHHDPVVAEGDFTMLLPEDPVIYAFTRTLEKTTLLVVANFSSAEHTVTGLPEITQWAEAEHLLGTHPPASDAAPRDGDLVLRPWEARILRRTT